MALMHGLAELSGQYPTYGAAPWVPQLWVRRESAAPKHGPKPARAASSVAPCMDNVFNIRAQILGDYRDCKKNYLVKRTKVIDVISPKSTELSCIVHHANKKFVLYKSLLSIDFESI